MLCLVDCRSVGLGDKAITYLGRNLYRGGISEKNLVAMDAETVTYRYTENSGRTRTRTIRGEAFLWLLIKHTLPKWFRRARNYGFLHSNCRTLLRLLQVLLLRTGLPSIMLKHERPTIACSRCGSAMMIVALGLKLEPVRCDTEPNQRLQALVM